jgi:hypothetical protein
MRAKKSPDQLFSSSTEDFELCDELFCRVNAFYGKNIDVSRYRAVDRVLILVWHSMATLFRKCSISFRTR